MLFENSIKEIGLPMFIVLIAAHPGSAMFTPAESTSVSNRLISYRQPHFVRGYQWRVQPCATTKSYCPAPDRWSRVTVPGRPLIGDLFSLSRRGPGAGQDKGANSLRRSHPECRTAVRQLATCFFCSLLTAHSSLFSPVRALTGQTPRARG
jgi:hypothetical protein